MNEFFTRVDPRDIGPLVSMLTAGIVVISLVAIIQWRRLRQTGMEVALKQQMLERGMSADEIVQVISATASKSCKDQPVARLRETAGYRS